MDLRLYLSTYETCIILWIVLLMTTLEWQLVLLEGMLGIMFEKLDPVWLARMWREDSESHRDMIDIIFILYLLKCRT